MPDQSRFPHTSWGNESYVSAIVESVDNFGGLLFSVTEIFGAVVTGNQKGIVRYHLISLFALHKLRNAKFVINF